MKKFIAPLMLLTVSTHALAVCEYERELRDKAKDLGLGFTSGTTVAGIGTGIAAKTGLISPWFIATAVIPGLVANNHCRIWGERERQLSNCLQGHRDAQARELERKQKDLEQLKDRNAKVLEINSRYDGLETTARQQHQARLRTVGVRFLQQGRNLRDPLVQGELREEIQRLETQLTEELQQLNDNRLQEINQI